ncbi:hypothetical protein UFOVP242_233 [uncultured Caudovirales phage]|uniref:Uncharacterized protein n=1 Tax=uncultured Caudovirales phage TaxID=2100421 RepID=A0A6J7WV86_9CAUD|nr:hypothetical protein UFOVP242_233 [uncultured Caudovirales phage]
MKPKILPVLEQCIEHGTIRGYNRAYKHDDDPSSDVITQTIFNCIMEEIHEWFEFSEKEIE